MMEYKGYTAKVEMDEEAGHFHGQVTNVRDVITFQGSSVAELRQEFQNSVNDYLEFCASRGEEPEKPYSGRFLIRIDPSLHRAAASAAARAGLSLNAWVSRAIERETEGASAPVAPHPDATSVRRTISLVSTIHGSG